MKYEILEHISAVQCVEEQEHVVFSVFDVGLERLKMRHQNVSLAP